MACSRDRTIISRSAEREDRCVVRPDEKCVPLYVGGEQIANLGTVVFLGLDRTGE
jgi:hypothetical protein